VKLSVALVALALCGCSSEKPDCDGTRVRVERGSSKLLDVCAAVRDTEAGRAQGLSGHAPLSADEGLLLDFPVEGEVCIVNGDVSFDIDVVFAAATGNVAFVEAGFPAGDAAARCHPGTQQVLEVAAGVALGVQVGDALVR
jgi:uncharacterized membrane protein (UPF0127 family)